MSWIDDALVELHEARNGDGGWAYRLRDSSATEPTSLAAMALHAHNVNYDGAVGWIEGRQLDDGSIPSTGKSDRGTWSTGLALVTLLRCGGSAGAIDRAVGFLLNTPVYHFGSGFGSPLNYNTNLRGWAWTEGDFSLVEPTSAALIALKQSAGRDHARVAEGVGLLIDRRNVFGAWNYGEPSVFDTDLPSQTVPSALVALALQDADSADTAQALQFLQDGFASLSTLFSTGWSAIALAAHGMLGGAEADLIGHRWQEAASLRRGTLETALALLAVAPLERNPLVFA